jgi:hypothetical protein
MMGLPLSISRRPCDKVHLLNIAVPELQMHVPLLPYHGLV